MHCNNHPNATWCVLLLLGARALLACSPSPDPGPLISAVPPTEVAATPIVHGIPDRGRDPAVVALSINGEGLCSGTLIAEDAVLTARHCVAETLSLITCPATAPQIFRDRDPATVRVFVGENIAQMQYVASGWQIIAPPGDALCGADIAILLLDRRVKTIAPLPIRERGAAKGEYVRAVGFGKRSDNAVSGVKYLREHVRVLFSTSNEFQVGEATCSGDSGGPALDENTGEIVGIVSRGGPSCEGEGVFNIYTRADVFHALVQTALNAPLYGQNGPEVSTGRLEDGGALIVDAGPDAADWEPVRDPARPKKPETNMGAACEKGDDCSTGICISDGERQYCSRSCGTGDRCPNGYRCKKTQVAQSVCMAH